MIESQKVQHRRVKVMNVNTVFHDIDAIVVRLAMGDPPANARTGSIAGLPVPAAEITAGRAMLTIRRPSRLNVSNGIWDPGPPPHETPIAKSVSWWWTTKKLYA